MKRIILSISILCVASLACSIRLGGNAETSQDANITASSTARLAPITTPTPARASVTALQSLNVRQRAGEYQKVIGALYAGDLVTLTGDCSDGWAEIIWSDSVAWVNSDYLSENRCKK